jgi:hypothetical protein
VLATARCILVLYQLICSMPLSMKTSTSEVILVPRRCPWSIACM